MTGVYRFANCVIDLRARTVVREGQAQAFEPKVYDVVAYLMENHERVVTKRELLEQVWGRHVVVTEGVIARTVMKARRLIGDDASEPLIIRTVHRIGYRFVADLEHREHAVADANGRSMPPGAKIRLAILPVRNGSARHDLGWADLGLMTAMIDALHNVPGMAAVPARDLLAIVGAGRQSDDEPAMDRRIHDALGVPDVLRSELLDDPGGFALHWQGSGPLGAALQGSARGPDPLELSRELVLHVCKSLDRHAAPVPFAPPPPRQDSYLGVTRARALAAIHHERWETARRLLRVALDIAPSDVSLQFDYSRCLAWIGDDEADDNLDALLDRARATQDRALELRVLHLMAIHRQSAGDLRQADELLSQSLALAEDAGDREAELDALVSLGELLASTGGPAVASWTVDRAAALAAELGNQMVMARVLDLRGQLAMVRGDLPAAVQTLERAALLDEDLSLHGGAALACQHMASSWLGLGHLEVAGRWLEKSLDHAMQSGQPLTIGIAGLAHALWGGLHRGRPQVAADTIRLMREAMPESSANGSAHADLAEGLLRLREGQGALGLSLLERAQEHGQGHTFAYDLAQQRVRVLVCLGRLEDAANACRQSSARRGGHVHLPAGAMGSYGLALVARAEGAYAEALGHLDDCIGGLPTSVERMLAVLDAAWLHLEDGDAASAQARLALLGDGFAQARQDEFAPALLVQARVKFEAGDAATACSLQERYCDLLGCPEQTAARRLLGLYRRRESGEPVAALPRLLVLPSLSDIVPGLGPARVSHPG